MPLVVKLKVLYTSEYSTTIVGRISKSRGLASVQVKPSEHKQHAPEIKVKFSLSLQSEEPSKKVNL